MLFKAKIQLNNLLFFSALTLCMIRHILDSSLYDYILPGIWTRLINGLVLAILVMKWLMVEEYTGRKLVIWACVFALLVIIAVTNGYLDIFVVIALAFSAQDISFDDILKCVIINLCVLTIFIIGSCALGILDDYTYVHNIVSFVDMAHSLGFKYYSTLGYIAMTITAIYLYMNRNCSYITLIIIAVANSLFFFVHTTILAIAVSFIMIGVYLITVKWKWLKFEKKIWDYLAVLAPLGLFTGTVLIVFIYANGGFSINIPFLGTIVGRLEYSIQALDEYGIHLFGSRVTMYGNTALYYGDAESGFYIDSGYIYLLIAYGIVISIVAIGFYMCLSHYVYLQHDAYLYVWLILILGICIINNFVFSVAYNPLLLLLPKALFSVYERKTKIVIQDTEISRRILNRQGLTLND